MSIATFIPQMWSARLMEYMRASLVYTNLFNRSYEGDIKQMGDTVHINMLSEVTIKKYTKNQDIADPDQLATIDQTLVLDQGDYFNFYLNDVDKAQAAGELMEKAMQSASYGLADKLDRYLASLLTAGSLTAGLGTTTTPLYVAKTGGDYDAYDLLVQMKTALDKADVPTQGRKVVVPPDFEGVMLLDQRFASAGGSNAEHRLLTGLVGRAAGFDIFSSNNVPNASGAKFKIVATVDAVSTYADQILQTEAYRREKGFDDGVKGLHVYGAKVLQPAKVAVATVNFGAKA